MNLDVSRLGSWLPQRRWFGHKDATIDALDLVDAATLDDGPPALVLAIVRVSTDGESHLYHLPLLVGEDGDLRDAAEDPARLALLGDLMAHGHTVKGDFGVFTFSGGGLDPMAPPGGESIRALGAEQSHTSVVFDEKVILKLFRSVASGPNPDVELGRLLTAEGFEHMPAQVGEIAYEGEPDESDLTIDIGVARAFASDAADGWEETVRHLRDLLGQVHPADASEDIPFLIEERGGAFLQSLDELGEAVAAMHVALVREEGEADLIAEDVTRDDLVQWAGRIRRALDDARDLPADVKARLGEVVGRLTAVGEAGKKTRTHGDLHLGQVLATPRGWLLLDFEGEPARPLEDRRSKESPLRDVAGMVRSFSYAGATAARNAGDDERGRLEAWAARWEELARERFLAGYVRKSHEGSLLPHDREEFARMLDVFEIEKALYELDYERLHRPDWIDIPRSGLVAIANRMTP